MGRILKYLTKYVNDKHNLTVNVNENEGIVSMSQETFNEIMIDYKQLIFANIVYAILFIALMGCFALIITL